MALTGYERYQLEWMIDHGHSLGELVDELTGLQNVLEATPGVNLSVREVFDTWVDDHGFGSEIFACEAEWRKAVARQTEKENRRDAHVSLKDAAKESRDFSQSLEGKEVESLPARDADAQ